MKKIILCGHTGSENRGCEAIIRSTITVLKACGVKDIEFTAYTEKGEEEIIREGNAKIILLPKKSFFKRALGVIKRNTIGYSVKDFEFLYNNLFKTIDKNNTVLFNIGGDTYCYETPFTSYALNSLSQKNGVSNVFWGCSVDEKLLENEEMISDVNKYSAIMTREAISLEYFEKCVADKSKIHKICDPAFHLESRKTELPDGFKIGNTLGLNISHLVFKDKNDENDIMYQNIYSLIDYVLENTDMHLCLIPHVYNIENNAQDIEVLRNIYKKYSENRRVSLVDKELSCTELKYIISSCRFFIGSRTHATIAAYSTGVPCIAISYSVKSRGIAIDLFGKETGYAMKYKDIKESDELLNNFKTTLLENEEGIKEIYKNTLPSYKQSIIDETKKILSIL